jgi:hypothetical protein
MNDLSVFSFSDLKSMRDYCLDALEERKGDNENEYLIVANLAEAEMLRRIISLLEHSNKNINQNP